MRGEKKKKKKKNPKTQYELEKKWIEKPSPDPAWKNKKLKMCSRWWSAGESKMSEWIWLLSDRGSLICVYLSKCHHNSVFITQKHQKVVFSFANSSLKNQRIKWWKRSLKTQSNRLSFHETHQFWVMGDVNSDRWWKLANPNSLQASGYTSDNLWRQYRSQEFYPSNAYHKLWDD